MAESVNVPVKPKAKASMPLVSIVTCTGSRPEAFVLCEKLLGRQTYKGPLQWIVIDDSGRPLVAPSITGPNIDVVHRTGPRTWAEGLNTQRFNMEEALKHIRGEVVFFFEDDDWYHPEFIERMLYFLKRYPIVGEGNSKYFNVGAKAWREMRNTRSSSLSQTGIHKSVLPILKAAVDSGEFFFDMYLWRKAFEKKLEFLVFNERQFSVGMKGLPGRAGLGTGHTVNWNDRWIPDPKLSKLKEWIGEDVDLYRKFMVEKPAAVVKKPMVGSSMVERSAVNRKAAGSSPARPVPPKAALKPPAPSNQTAPLNQTSPFRPALFKENTD